MTTTVNVGLSSHTVEQLLNNKQLKKSKTNVTALKKINTPNRADAWRKKRNQPLISQKDAFPYKITKSKKMYFIILKYI